MLDTSGTVLWNKRYNYPGANKIIQKDSTFYVIGYDNNEAYIHHIDQQGYTLFCRKIVHTQLIQLSDISIKDSATFLLSGLIKVSASNFYYPFHH